MANTSAVPRYDTDHKIVHGGRFCQTVSGVDHAAVGYSTSVRDAPCGGRAAA